VAHRPALHFLAAVRAAGNPEAGEEVPLLRQPLDVLLQDQLQLAEGVIKQSQTALLRSLSRPSPLLLHLLQVGKDGVCALN